MIFNDEKIEIKNNDGESLYIQIYQEEPDTFIAYYPEENLIQLKDFMQGDTVISTESGKKIEEAPTSRNYSPGGKYRMSSFYNTEETIWFIQENINGKWITLNDLSENKNLHTVKKFYWINDKSFVFYQRYYEKYYLGTLVQQ